MKINLQKLSRRIVRTIIFLVALYLITLIFFYFKQERFFFNPKHLDKDYVFEFAEPFEEINIEAEKDIYLNADLFKRVKLEFKIENQPTRAVFNISRSRSRKFGQETSNLNDLTSNIIIRQTD